MCTVNIWCAESDIVTSHKNKPKMSRAKSVDHYTPLHRELKLRATAGCQGGYRPYEMLYVHELEGQNW